MSQSAMVYVRKGKWAIVDEEDYCRVAHMDWAFNNKNNTVYTALSRKEAKARKQPRTVYLSRLLMNFPPGKVVDHKNHDTLDNRRSTNLRVCSWEDNGKNRRVYLTKIKKSSKYKGVSWCAEQKKWRVSIRLDKRLTYIGRFDDEERAAKAYNDAAIIYFGEFSFLNEIQL